jgi:hypothetical protein
MARTQPKLREFQIKAKKEKQEKIEQKSQLQDNKPRG